MKTIKLKTKTPFRFLTLENAERFLVGNSKGNPDMSLTVLPYINKTEGICINPDYVSAQFEMRIIKQIQDDAEIPTNFEQ